MSRRIFGTAALVLAFMLVSAVTMVAEDSTVEPCKEQPESCDDERENMDIHAFVGSAIDNFAADDVTRYLNPDASGDVQTFERLVAGIDFSYRLVGKQEKDRQLWIYGGTIHGVRSTEIDCQENSNLAVCQDFFEEGQDPTERFLFIARNASSLEAHFGVRAELLRLQSRRDHSASFFVSGQYGFVTVSGAGDDVKDLYHYGLGVIATEGPFRGSYFEVGHGGSDLFLDNPDNRWKFIGQVNWWPEFFGGGRVSSFFARILVDADLKEGSDSVQSYFGMRFTLFGRTGSSGDSNGGSGS